MQKFIRLITAVTVSLSYMSCQTKGSTEGASAPPAPVMDAKLKDYKEAQRNSVEFQLNIPYRSLDTSKSIDTFAFGSCNHQDQDQPLWPLIEKNNPQLFLMLGDNVYASAAENKPIFAQYLKLNKNQNYRALRERVPILAIWDDHDFGQNDGGESNPEKEEARRVFLNYWGYLKPTLPKNQMALYHSRLIGKAPQRLQVIMLDTRWDRSDLIKNPDYNPNDETVPPKLYFPNTDRSAKILSKEQWAWLEDELKKPAEMKIIVSSIQVIAETPGFEKWGNFPNEKAKLLNLLKKYKNVVLLSGDRHISVVSKINLQKNHDLYELTASGLNRPSRAKTPESDPSYIKGPYLQINYGLGRIQWKQRILSLEIHGADDQVQFSQDIKF